MRYAFDWCGTLDSCASLRDHAREVFATGHEVHIVSGTGDPACVIEGLSGKPYPVIAAEFGVPYTALHIIYDRGPAATAMRKAEVLREIGAGAFYDDLPINIAAAREAGIRAVLITPATVISESIESQKDWSSAHGQ
jgi:acid phosphatase class B